MNLAVLKAEATGVTCGTPTYMSPTSHDKMPQTEIDDFVSLGFVFIELGGGTNGWTDRPMEEYCSLKRHWDEIEVNI